MDPLKTYLGRLVLEEITPVVMVLTTPLVEDSCRKNGLSFVEMLLPFSVFKKFDVPVRTVNDQPYRLQMFKLRMVYASDVRQPNYEAAKEQLKQVVHDSGEKALSDLLPDPPQLETILNRLENLRLPLLGRSWRSPLFSSSARTLACSLVHRSTYVDVTMKWKKDPFFDSIGVLARSRDLKPLVSLKSIIADAPSDVGIPVSAVSKRGRALETSGCRVASFLRRYPAVFDEYTGPNYNLPWFRLTEEAADLDREERAVYDARKAEIIDRLRRLILMSRDCQLPFRIVQGMLWYLGLPEDFLEDPNNISDGGFGVIEIGDGEKGLSVVGGGDEPVFSVLQQNALRQFGGLADSPPKEVAFPLFPSRGLRLKRKIEHWLDEFQKLPYVSPYEDFSHLDPSSDISEKRAAGVLHELLSLFVDNSAERRRLLCLRKHLGLSQKFHKVFERHPHVFYLLLKSKTCFVVLKEAYFAGSDTALERHPMLEIRKKYVKLMDKSDTILRSRRCRKPLEDAAAGS